jgi:hypothetical protein
MDVLLSRARVAEVYLPSRCLAVGIHVTIYFGLNFLNFSNNMLDIVHGSIYIYSVSKSGFFSNITCKVQRTLLNWAVKRKGPCV